MIFKGKMNLNQDQIVSIRMTANRIKYLAADIDELMCQTEPDTILINDYIVRLNKQVAHLLMEFEDE